MSVTRECLGWAQYVGPDQNVHELYGGEADSSATQGMRAAVQSFCMHACSRHSSWQAILGLKPPDSALRCCRAEFIFENPQAKGTCGCGESFTT